MPTQYTPEQLKVLSEIISRVPPSMVGDTTEGFTQKFADWQNELEAKRKEIVAQNELADAAAVTPETAGVPINTMPGPWPTSGYPQTPQDYWAISRQKQGVLASAGRAFASEAVLGLPRIFTNAWDISAGHGSDVSKRMTGYFNSLIGMGEEDRPVNGFGALVGTLLGFAVPLGVIAKGVGVASKAALAADTTGTLARFAGRSPNMFRFAQHLVESGLQELTTEEPTYAGATMFAVLDTVARSRTAATLATKIFKPGSFKTLGTFTKYWDVEGMRWLRAGNVDAIKDKVEVLYLLANHIGSTPGELAAVLARPAIVDIFQNATVGMKEVVLHRKGEFAHVVLQTIDNEEHHIVLDSLKSQTALTDELLAGSKIKTIAGPKRLITEFRRAFTEQTPQEARTTLDMSLAKIENAIANGAPRPTGPGRVNIINTARRAEHSVSLDDVRNLERFAKAAREGVLNDTLIVEFEGIDPANAEQVKRARDFIKSIYGKRLNAEIPNVFYGPSTLPKPTATFRIEGSNPALTETVTKELTSDGNLIVADREFLKQHNAELVAFNLNPTTMQDIAFRLKLAQNLKDMGPSDILYRRRMLELSNRRRAASPLERQRPTGGEAPTPSPEGPVGPPGGPAPEGTPGATPPSEQVRVLGEQLTPPTKYNATWTKADGSTESVHVQGWTSDGHAILEGNPSTFPPRSQINEWGVLRDVPEPPSPPTPPVARAAPPEVPSVPIDKPQSPRSVFAHVAAEASKAGYSEAEVMQIIGHARGNAPTLTSREKQFIWNILIPHTDAWMAVARGAENPEALAKILEARMPLFDQLTQLFRIGDINLDEYLLRYWLVRNLPEPLARVIQFIPSKALAMERYIAKGGVGVTEFLDNVARISTLKGANVMTLAHELGEVMLAQLDEVYVKKLAFALKDEIQAMLAGKTATTVGARWARDPKEMLVEYIGERIGKLAFNPSAVKGEIPDAFIAAEHSALGTYLREGWRSVTEVFGVHTVHEKKEIFKVIDEVLADVYWGGGVGTKPQGMTMYAIAKESREIIEKTISGALERGTKPTKLMEGVGGGRIAFAHLVNLSARVKQNTFGRIMRLHPDWDKWVKEGKLKDPLKLFPRGGGITGEPDYVIYTIPFDTRAEAEAAARWYTMLLGDSYTLGVKKGVLPAVGLKGNKYFLKVSEDFAGAVIGAGRPSAIAFQEISIKPLAELGEAGVVHANNLRNEFKQAAATIAKNLKACAVPDDFYPGFELTAKSGYPRLALRQVIEGAPREGSLVYYPGIDISPEAKAYMAAHNIPIEDAVYGFDDAAHSAATAGRFMRATIRSRAMSKGGLEIDVVPREEPGRAKWKHWFARFGKDTGVRIDPDDPLADQLASGVVAAHSHELTGLQVFNGTDAAIFLSKYPEQAKMPRLYLRDQTAENVFWYLRSSKEGFDPTVDKIISTQGYMQRAGKWVDDVAGVPPPEVREALEMGYELVGVSGKLPKTRGLHEALESSIKANVQFPKEGVLNLKPEKFEAIRGMASMAGLDARLTENGIELTRRFNPQGHPPVTVNSLDELRNAVGKYGLEPDLVLTSEEWETVKPFMEKVQQLVEKSVGPTDPALPLGSVFARGVQRVLNTAGIKAEQSPRFLGTARGVQNAAMALSAPMNHLAGRLQKALPEFPVWDWYQRAHMGFKQMEHYAGEDVRELGAVLNSLSNAEQRIVTYYLKAGGSRQGLTPGERAILATFESQNKELLSPKVRSAANSIRTWFDTKGPQYHAFRRPDEAPYIDAYVPWRAEAAPRQAREGVVAGGAARPAADAWFTKARMETEFNPMYDDRIGSLVAQYALGGRRMEYLVPVSRDMVDGLKKLEALAAANNGTLPSSTHLYTKWALNNMNNVITGQDGTLSSMFYGGLFKMLKGLTGSTKLATAVTDNLLSWGYGVGLGFRPGAAARNAIFAPVPIFTMLGGKHLAHGISSYLDLVRGGKASVWAKWLDPINTQFGRHFLDQSVPIYRYISGGKESAQGFIAKALQKGLWMQEATERVNRSIAYFSGVSAGEDIFTKFAKTPDLTRVFKETALRMMVEPEQKMLAKLLVSGNKEEFIKEFAAGVVRLTQFAYGPIESFMLGNTKGGKLLFFYGTWSANMLHFLGRAAGATVEDGVFRPLSPHGIKFLARWGVATGLGWSTYTAMGINPKSTFALGPTSYTGSPYMQFLLDFADWMREPGRASEEAKIKFFRRAQQLSTPFGAAVSDGRKMVEDIENDKWWNAFVHIFLGTTPTEESALAKAGVRVHKRGWGIW